MANPQKDSDKDRKFFFDLHDFTDPNEKGGKHATPVFSAEEMEAARQSSFDQGRLKGLNEANASREQTIANTLQQIAAQFAVMFAGEQEREMRYEQEAVLLTLRTLEKLFPAMNEKIGAFEAEQAVRKVLKSAADQSEISIRIHPDFTGDIEAIVAPLRNKDVNPPTFHIIGDAALAPGDCRLSWADGGAVRDAAFLARTIKADLMDLLPGVESGPEEEEESTTAEATPAENNDINEEVRPESPDSGPESEPAGETNP